MLIPRYTTRTLLLLMVFCGVFSMICTFALRGEAWAVAVTLGAAGLLLAFISFGLFFVAAWVLAGLLGWTQRRPLGASPFANAALPPQIIPPEEPE